MSFLSVDLPTLSKKACPAQGRRLASNMKFQSIYTGEKGSVYSTYIEGEYRQTNGPAAGGDDKSVIA